MGTIASPVFRQARVNARARAAAPFARRAQGRVLGHRLTTDNNRLTANLTVRVFPPRWISCCGESGWVSDRSGKLPRGTNQIVPFIFISRPFVAAPACGKDAAKDFTVEFIA